MPRITDPDVLAALVASNIQPAIFVAITFGSGTAYLWTGVGTVTWNSQTWTGLGSLLGFSVIEESPTVEARGIQILLSGLDSGLLASCLGDFKLGQVVAVYMGLYSGGSLLPTPIAMWSGRTDQPTIEIAADGMTIALNCETRLLDMNIPVDRRYTHQDQQMDWPGDLGLQFVDSLQEMTVYWGQQANGTNNL